MRTPSDDGVALLQSSFHCHSESDAGNKKLDRCPNGVGDVSQEEAVARLQAWIRPILQKSVVPPPPASTTSSNSPDRRHVQRHPSEITMSEFGDSLHYPESISSVESPTRRSNRVIARLSDWRFHTSAPQLSLSDCGIVEGDEPPVVPCVSSRMRHSSAGTQDKPPSSQLAWRHPLPPDCAPSRGDSSRHLRAEPREDVLLLPSRLPLVDDLQDSALAPSTTIATATPNTVGSRWDHEQPAATLRYSGSKTLATATASSASLLPASPTPAGACLSPTFHPSLGVEVSPTATTESPKIPLRKESSHGATTTSFSPHSITRKHRNAVSSSTTPKQHRATMSDRRRRTKTSSKSKNAASTSSSNTRPALTRTQAQQTLVDVSIPLPQRQESVTLRTSNLSAPYRRMMSDGSLLANTGVPTTLDEETESLSHHYQVGSKTALTTIRDASSSDSSVQTASESNSFCETATSSITSARDMAVGGVLDQSHILSPTTPRPALMREAASTHLIMSPIEDASPRLPRRKLSGREHDQHGSAPIRESEEDNDDEMIRPPLYRQLSSKQLNDDASASLSSVTTTSSLLQTFMTPCQEEDDYQDDGEEEDEVACKGRASPILSRAGSPPESNKQSKDFCDDSQLFVSPITTMKQNVKRTESLCYKPESDDEPQVLSGAGDCTMAPWVSPTSVMRTPWIQPPLKEQEQLPQGSKKNLSPTSNQPQGARRASSV